eukprot:12406088-Ditylum_brightwellii.AAC.1
MIGNLYNLDGRVRCVVICCVCDAIIDALEVHADGLRNVHRLLHLFVIVDDVTWGNFTIEIKEMIQHISG